LGRKKEGWMTEAEKPMTTTPADRDATLVAPRFDETEAQTAQPVVPLAPTPRARRRRPRLWPLLLLSAVLGGAFSVFGLRLYQQRRAHAALAPSTASQPAARITQLPSTLSAQPGANAMPAPVPTTAASEPYAPATASVKETAQPHRLPDAQAKTTTQPNAERTPAQAKREATKHEPPRRATPEESAAQPARAHDGAVRPRLVDVLRGDERDDRDESDRAMRRRAWRHWRRDHPPEQDEPQREHAPRQQRGADRIRDIFEGARPPV
jgi:hypothetical protein